MMRTGLLLISLLMLASPAYARIEIQEVKLGKQPLWLVEDHTLPLVTLQLTFKGAGAANDLKGKEGRAYLVSELLEEGAGNLDALNFQQKLEETSAKLSFSLSDDAFFATLTCIKAQCKESLALLQLALTQPRFDAEAIKRVQSQTLSTLRELSEKPGYIASRALAEAMFAGHPYAAPTLGTPASVQALGKKDFAFFMTNHLTQANVLIAMVGDVEKAEAETLISPLLAALPVAYAPDVTVPEWKPATAAVDKFIEKNVPQTTLLVATPAPKRSDANYIPTYVANFMLGGESVLTSRLGSEIREKRGLTYSVGSSLEPNLYGSIWMGSFATRKDQADEALKVFNTTFEQFAKEGATAKELTEAKDYINGSFVLSLDTNARIASFLSTMQLYSLGMDYLDRRKSLIEAVSLEQAHEALRALASHPNRVTLRVGQPATVTTPQP